MNTQLRTYLFLIIVAFVAGGAYLLRDTLFGGIFAPAPSQELTGLSKEYLQEKGLQPTVIADKLSTPWEIQFLTNGDMLVTEQTGTLVRIPAPTTFPADPSSYVRIPVANVATVGNTGLRGLEVHPNFADNNRIYLMYSIDDGAEYRSTVMSYELKDNTLVRPYPIIEELTGSTYNNGGRLAFGPDSYLYITVGDALQPKLAQDLGSLNGKILRVNADGTAIDGNPFQSRIFSYGHRNPEGMTWTDNGLLWSSEHGRDQNEYGLDEINLIFASNNYGWPEIEGDKTRADMKTPVLNSGPSMSWDPTSIEFAYGSLFFSSGSGKTLYEAQLSKDRTKITKLVAHFKNDYGRIRRVKKGPDGHLYLLTDNSKHPDGKKGAVDTQDSIIRIDKKAFE